MIDIGSIFPLYREDLCHEDVIFSNNSDKYFFSLCREALSVIARHENNCDRTILIPAYTCSTVIIPFLEKDWKCYYYSINKDLTINIESVRELVNTVHPCMFLTHPYYGMDLNEQEVSMLRELHQCGIKLIVDLTQCIYSEQHLDFVDYYVGSYRKWYQVPDGGYLQSKTTISCDNLKENDTFVQPQIDSMYLRGVYFNNGDEEIKQISIRLNKMAVKSVNFHVKPHAMSTLSRMIMPRLNHDEFAKQRMHNFKYLFDNLSDYKNIELVCKDINRVTTSPLYFTIYTSNRKRLQKELAINHIYAPVIWPMYYENVVIDEIVRNIYDTILAIPIDQRYGEDDMKKIIRVIAKAD